MSDKAPTNIEKIDPYMAIPVADEEGINQSVSIIKIII